MENGKDNLLDFKRPYLEAILSAQGVDLDFYARILGIP